MLSCGLFSGGQNEVVEVFEQSRALVVLEQIVEQGRMLEGTPSPGPRHDFWPCSLFLFWTRASRASHDFEQVIFHLNEKSANRTNASLCSRLSTSGQYAHRSDCSRSRWIFGIGGLTPNPIYSEWTGLSQTRRTAMSRW